VRKFLIFHMVDLLLVNHVADKGKPVETLEQFCYLGSLIDSSGSDLKT